MCIENNYIKTAPRTARLLTRTERLRLKRAIYGLFLGSYVFVSTERCYSVRSVMF